jgi:AcrR family transcriptional regulator
MRAETKNVKEAMIIKAAEQVFGQYGFKNARMEDVATLAQITKVTVYSYFRSKENLYMAITYNALSEMVKRYEETVIANKRKRGAKSVICLMETFLDFCKENYLYSEVLLDYFSMIRSVSEESDEKLTSAMKESVYYEKVKEIHNIPFKITAAEIKRGIKDGSISKNVDPMIGTIYGWMTALGYAKILASSGNSSSLFKVKFEDLKKATLGIQYKMLAKY